VVSLAERRRCVTYLRNEYTVSERRACQVMEIHRSSYRYAGQQELVDAAYREVVRLSQRYPYFGYRKIYALMRDSWTISRERVRQIRRREGLQVVKKRRKRKLLGVATEWVNRAQYPNHVWSYDFVYDQTDDGRQLKCLTVVDEFSRQGLEIRVGRSLTATDVTSILDELFRQHGRPACIRSDNGPELVSRHVQNWLREKHVDTHYIDPGSPWQNAYNESFNSIFRTTCLDRCLFGSMTEARVIIGHWLDEYNTVRPHGSHGGMTPEQFLQRWTENNIDQQPKSLTG
jgi:transposase InsO family protein